MAKIVKGNEKITVFGEINVVLDKFNTLIGEVIDRVSSILSTSTVCQYSEIIRSSSCCLCTAAMSRRVSTSSVTHHHGG